MRPTWNLACPAKINLHLRIGPRRADGFHPLLTWMCTVGLDDTLTLVVHRQGSSSVRFHLTSDARDLPCDERNLIVRVAAAWPAHGAPPASAHTEGPTEIRATLVKRIPVGAGLGGGSSDAARTLLALHQRFPRAEGSPADDLTAFAAQFGSDVPFFLRGPSSVCTGRGEAVRPIARPRPRWALLVLPPIHMPTADVYRRFDAMGLGREQDVSAEPDWAAWAQLPAAELLPRLVNDLEPPAFALRPDLAALRASAEKQLGRVVRMSGSGSSLFTLYDDEPDAGAAAGHVAGLGGENALRVEVVRLAPRVRDDLDGGNDPVGGE